MLLLGLVLLAPAAADSSKGDVAVVVNSNVPVGNISFAELRRVFLGGYDPEALPSQLIRPASGRLTLLLDRDAAALLPKPNADGVGVLEVSR